MEKKYFGGNMEKNVAYGLCWLPFIGWIISLVMFIMDKDTLDLDEKRELVSIFICAILGYIPVLGTVILVVTIIKCIMAFLSKPSFQVPGAYHIAAAIIK